MHSKFGNYIKSFGYYIYIYIYIYIYRQISRLINIDLSMKVLNVTYFPCSPSVVRVTQIFKPHISDAGITGNDLSFGKQTRQNREKKKFSFGSSLPFFF